MHWIRKHTGLQVLVFDNCSIVHLMYLSHLGLGGYETAPAGTSKIWENANASLYKSPLLWDHAFTTIALELPKLKSFTVGVGLFGDVRSPRDSKRRITDGTHKNEAFSSRDQRSLPIWPQRYTAFAALHGLTTWSEPHPLPGEEEIYFDLRVLGEEDLNDIVYQAGTLLNKQDQVDHERDAFEKLQGVLRARTGH